MFTRDSNWLTGLQVAAIVLGTLSVGDPASYGLTPITMKWIALGAVLVGTLAGKLATSPLPGKNDDDKVKVN